MTKQVRNLDTQLDILTVITAARPAATADHRQPAGYQLMQGCLLLYTGPSADQQPAISMALAQA